MAPQGLERVAEGRAPLAVIDDEGRAALRCEAAGEGRARASPAMAGTSRMSPGAAGGREPGLGGAGEAEDEALAVEPDEALAPAPSVRHELAYRQGIEELVGEDEQRAVGHVVEPRRARSTGDAGRGKGGAAGAARSAGLVSTRWTLRARRESAAASARPPAGRRHQRAAAGAELDQAHAARARPWRARPRRSQRPSSSPNIWLISGAVVKSPAAPRGSRVA